MQRDYRGVRYGIPAGFSEGLVDLCKNGKFGFADTTGKIVIPFEYDDAYCFAEGLAAVEKNGKWGFINKLNEAVIPFIY
ncbi:MAG: WG repeat-containing protein [Oscillospiraceae bacterium]|nr:WG repeat-containing protein [Oscillospiraceae bacterium]